MAQSIPNYPERLNVMTNIKGRQESKNKQTNPRVNGRVWGDTL